MKRSQRYVLFRLFLLFLLPLLIILSIIIIKRDQKPSVPESAGAGESAARAREVIDGDTFLAGDGRKVRLLGIDCPERGEQYYRQATAFLKEFIINDNTELTLVSGRKMYDRYGRRLAFVFADSVFVNEMLVRQGLARAYFFGKDDLSTQYRDQICSAQRAAIERGIGIWSVTPDNLSDRYFANPQSHRFHRPSCNAVVSGDTTEMIRSTDRMFFLKQCYSPCRNCRP